MNDLEFKKNYSALIPPSYGVANPSPSQAQKTQKSPQSSELAALVRQSLSKNSQLNFSKHAVQRLESHSIGLSPERLIQLNDAVEKARAKGVHDTLILDGGMTFIVNVPNSTVVTTLNDREIIDNVFTNIDGAAVL